MHMLNTSPAMGLRRLAIESLLAVFPLLLDPYWAPDLGVWAVFA